jgi:hypothetical protein
MKDYGASKIKNRLPSWVNAILQECPDTPRNPTFYRHVYKPKVPTIGFFSLMFDTIDLDKRTELLNTHVVPKIHALVDKGITSEADKQSLKMLCKLVNRFIPKGLPLSSDWVDKLLVDNYPEEMSKAVSPYEVMTKNGMGMTHEFLKTQIDYLAKKMEVYQPTEIEIADPSNSYTDAHRFTEWLQPPRRTRMYELQRTGFDIQFQPSAHSAGMFTSVILQSLYYILQDKYSPMRSPDMTRAAKMSDYAGLNLRPDLGPHSEEWKILNKYLLKGGLKSVTLDMNLKQLSVNLDRLLVHPSSAGEQEWRNLLLYRLIGQIALPKFSPEMLIGLSTLYRVPLHQMTLFLYDLSSLLGRRMFYLPSMDKSNAYMETELENLLTEEQLDHYHENYTGIYIYNVERFPSSQKKWAAHYKTLLEKAGLADCKTPMQAVLRIVSGNPLTASLPAEVGKDASRIGVVSEEPVSELYGEEEVDETLELMDDDEDDDDQVEEINHLLHLDTPSPSEEKVEEYLETTKPNDIPKTNKPVWNWDE